jgi:hypothetical protein
MFVAGVVEAAISWTRQGQWLRRATQYSRVAAEGFCLWMLQVWLVGVSVRLRSVYRVNCHLSNTKRTRR